VTTDEGPDVLGNFYLVREAAADDLMEVEALVTRERYARSQLIFREGDDAHAMYLVELGCVHPQVRVRAAIDEGVPAPVLSTALTQRFASRGDEDFANKLLSAMRYQFGGHEEKH
jgi:hypothetical protein